MNWDKKRATMVRQQLRRRGVTDERVLKAMGTVPRHEFVPASVRGLAYADGAQGIGGGQTISQPLVVANMAQMLAIEPGDRVLEVGAGSGYAAAVMAEMGAHVWGVEQDTELAERARGAVADWPQVTIVHGDGRKGLVDQAPFDAISVAAAADEVPTALLDQLADGGRLVMPVGPSHDQVLTLVQRRGDEFRREDRGRVRFVPLLDSTA